MEKQEVEEVAAFAIKSFGVPRRRWEAAREGSCEGAKVGLKRRGYEVSYRLIVHGY